ncbi:MAG: ABC transporter ATP-binding protein [Clostridia bacterium]|nr:ABC transporter ATP-binding protein [Clostridia bacterium]
MIEINNLVKHYGETKAVNGISFNVNKGEVLGFLGPNGAGKSTTMNIITGYLSSTSGSVKVNGHDILEEPELAKKSIGYLPELPPLYLDMTVIEYLSFIADLKKVPKAERKEQLAKILAMVKIANVSDRLIGNLSKGYKQRVGIAQALVGNPEILILDEPTVGLDPNQILEIRKLIKGLANEHTVILSSHILSEIQAVCDRVVIINKGKVAAISTINDLSSSASMHSKLVLTFKGDLNTVVNSFKSMPGIYNVDVNMSDNDVHEIELSVESEVDIRTNVFYQMVKLNCPIIGFTTRGSSLEEMFLSITSKV